MTGGALQRVGLKGQAQTDRRKGMAVKRDPSPRKEQPPDRNEPAQLPVGLY